MDYGLVKQLGLRLVPLDADTAVIAAGLELLHGDPIDRVLVATALRLGVPLLSRDRLLIEQRIVPVISD